MAKKMKAKDRKVRVNLTIDPVVAKAAKAMCKRDGMSLSQLVETLLKG